jgi:uncharacterized protein YndB with AHSA1/START domain
MITALLGFLGFLVVLVVAIVGYALATKPDSFVVQRTTNVEAPPEKLFELIEDFHKWTLWSPYEKLDPELKRTYGGALHGKGAVYEWEGAKAGSGRMEVTESTPSSRIVIALEFIKPFRGNSVGEFKLAPRADGSTSVTWATRGECNLASKVMQVFMNIDAMIGKDFEAGLANMKQLTESRAA